MQSSSITGRFRFVDELGKLGSLSSQITWSDNYLAAPTDINVNVINRTQVSASWNPVELATSYCYYDAGQGAWISTSQNSVQISGVLPGLPQTFTVFASDGSCRATGRYSPTYWYLPFSAPLTAPVDLAVQEISEVGLRISFTAPVGVDSYAVYRSDGKNWITGNSDSFIEDVFSDTDQGRNFTYRITAIETETYGSQYGDVSSGLSVSVPRKVAGAPTVDAGTVVVQTPVQNSAVIPVTPTIGIKKVFTAKFLAKRFGLKLQSQKASVSFSVSRSSKKVCSKAGLTLKTLKAGNCVVTFTVQEPKPKKGKQPKATKTVKTLVVQ
jgi:hypothetical protein